MTPYYKLPNWWPLCDAIRKDMNAEMPRMVLAEYVEENGHHDLAAGIRDAWTEGLVYFDDYSDEGYSEPWASRSKTTQVSYNRGFIQYVNSTSLTRVRSILSQLVRANIVLSVACGQKARKVRRNYKWYFDDEGHKRGEVYKLPMYLQPYVPVKHETAGKAYDAFSRGMIEWAIASNCDGSEGAFMNRNAGIKRLMGRVERYAPTVRNAIIAGVYGSKVASTYSEFISNRLPYVRERQPIVASVDPSVDPACTDPPDSVGPASQ